MSGGCRFINLIPSIDLSTCPVSWSIYAYESVSFPAINRCQLMSRRGRWLTPNGRWTLHGALTNLDFGALTSKRCYTRETGEKGVRCAVIHQSQPGFVWNGHEGGGEGSRLQWGWNDMTETYRNEFHPWGIFEMIAWVKDSNNDALQHSVHMLCSFRTTKDDG